MKKTLLAKAKYAKKFLMIATAVGGPPVSIILVASGSDRKNMNPKR
jgi:hypothetical protein